MLEGGYWSLLDPARARPPMWAPCVIFAQKEEPVCARRPPNQNEESRSNNFELGITSRGPNTVSLFRGSRLRIRSFFCHAFGSGRKLIAVNSLIERSRLHGPGCHLFRDLSGSNGIPPVISSRLWCYPFLPDPQKRLFPFHLCSPYVVPSLRLRAFAAN